MKFRILKVFEDCYALQKKWLFMWVNTGVYKPTEEEVEVLMREII